MRGVIVVVVGSLLLILGGVYAASCLQAWFYVPVRGVVKTSNVRQLKDLCDPVIVYSYVVDGVVYENDVYQPMDLACQGSRAWAEEVTRQYPPGAACAVHYNPSAPHKSVLDRTPNAAQVTIILLFVTLGGMLVLKGVCYVVLRKRSRESKEEGGDKDPEWETSSRPEADERGDSHQI